MGTVEERLTARTCKLPKEKNTYADFVGEAKSYDRKRGDPVGKGESGSTANGDPYPRKVCIRGGHGGPSSGGTWFDYANGEAGAETF